MLEVADCQVNVHQSGDGPPVLFLHGNPDSSLLWKPVVTAIDRRYRCIVADLPGFGHSTAPVGFDYSLAGQANYLSELVRALGVSQPIFVVAHDFGAIFAMAWMSRFPDMIRAALFSNTAFFADYPWHVWARLYRRRGLGELTLTLMTLRGMLFAYRGGDPPVPRSYVEAAYKLITPNVKRSILRLYRAVPPQSFAQWEPLYLQVAQRVPVTVLWGDADPYVPKHLAARFAARRVVHFRNSGHWLPLVEPTAFAREVNAFLEENAIAPLPAC